MKLRFSKTIIGFLEGTQAWADMNRTDSYEPESDLALMRRIAETPADKRGGVTITVTRDDIDYLDSCIGAMKAGARDCASEHRVGEADSAWAVGELNASTAMLRQMDKVWRESGGGWHA